MTSRDGVRSCGRGCGAVSLTMHQDSRRNTRSVEKPISAIALPAILICVLFLSGIS